MKKILLSSMILSSTGFAQKQMNSQTGSPVGDNQHSKTVGSTGPVLLEDIYLIEKLAAFDRERIPERVVHARGAGAFGYFESTKDMSSYTKAKLFSGNQQKTEVAVRFSTVVHSAGSPESLRDPRGFATKFYTTEGNYDIVGNNLPVFFIRDAIKFPDMVHAFKPSPLTNKQDGGRVFDFFSHLPEATHMLTRVYSDYGIPANYRQMNGSSVHGFKWINEAGKIVYVKYTWVSIQGEKNLTLEEASKVQSEDFQHATTDLFHAIKAGNYPKWDLYVQMIPEDQLNNYDFWPLDATKDWPASSIEKIKIGTMTLDRNPINYFQEIEQIAMAPGTLVPGIEPSADKLLQGRLFSYFDTQRHRLGTNFLQIDVNRPKLPVNNYTQDGANASENKKFENPDVNYEPSRKVDLKEVPQQKYSEQSISNVKITQSGIEKTNDFVQAGDFYRSLTKHERENLIKNMTCDLKAATSEVQKTMIGYFYQADKEYGTKLAVALKINIKEILTK